MKIIETSEILTKAKKKFKLDHMDIIILGRLQIDWYSGKEVKIMYVVEKLCADVASPASLHKRITSLAKAKFIKIVSNKTDTRTKNIQEGINFKKLEKYLGN